MRCSLAALTVFAPNPFWFSREDSAGSSSRLIPAIAGFLQLEFR